MEEPNYYAIIPASVRYDKNLIKGSTLLYGEITALSNQKGFCWASDNYFAELYGVDKRSIQRWLSSLEENAQKSINWTIFIQLIKQHLRYDYYYKN